MDTAQKLKEARKIATENGLEFQDVLRMMEIESRQATTLLICQIYEELQSVKQLLQEMKQFGQEPEVKFINKNGRA